MRGVRLEEKFAILGIFVVALLSLGVILEVRVGIQYSPVSLNNENPAIIEGSQEVVSNFIDSFKEILRNFSEEPARSYFIYTLLGILVLLIIFLLIRIKHKKQQKNKVNEKYDKLNDAKVFVSQLRSKGYEDLIIRQMFIEKGWNELDIVNIMS